jgi:hypothetical protein
MISILSGVHKDIRRGAGALQATRRIVRLLHLAADFALKGVPLV